MNEMLSTKPPMLPGTEGTFTCKSSWLSLCLTHLRVITAVCSGVTQQLAHGPLQESYCMCDLFKLIVPAQTLANRPAHLVSKPDLADVHGSCSYCHNDHT